MKTDLSKKLNNLKLLLNKLGSCVVAFSGGVDSSFLLYVARETLNGNLLAVIADSPTYTKRELKQAKAFANNLGIRHKVIRTEELDNPNFSQNLTNRCYFCKKELFSKLKDIAKNEGFNFVIDGQNLDDKKDFRPGSIAAQELGVRSPLKEAGIRKQDIRNLSKKLGLSTWDKSALACLASRFPYKKEITEEGLQRIQKAESFLYKLGFKDIRVRDYDNLCRIELNQNEIQKICQPKVRNDVIAKFKKLGYNYITVDLEGYRTGSMNPALSSTNIYYNQERAG